MISYAMTGYDVSRINCSDDDVADLPKDVREGSIAVSVADGAEEAYVLWKGEWTKFYSGR